MAALFDRRGPSAAYDLSALRAVPGLQHCTVCRPKDRTPTVVVSSKFSDSAVVVHMLVAPSGDVQVFLRESSGRKLALKGPWDQTGISQHFWLTPALFAARESLLEMPTECAP